MRVRPFEPPLLPRLLELVNLHLAAVVPGWALSEAFLAQHLKLDFTEPITDPWVRERTTLCAFDAGRLLSAAHLLRYGEGPEVGDGLRGAGEIDWFVSLPGREDAAAEVLAAAHECLRGWGLRREYGWSSGLPTIPMTGVPESLPHLVSALEAAGHERERGRVREALYGGGLDAVPYPGGPPEPGLTLGRKAGPWGTRFSALVGGKEEGGFCEVAADLTHGGMLPALGGWAGLQEVWIDEGRRNRGIGGWLVRHAAAWLRLAGCQRIILNVAASDEAAGAGRFYRRFGWDILDREAYPPGVPVEPNEPHDEEGSR